MPKISLGRSALAPNYQSEAHVYAQYILQNYAAAKIAILYQNDEYGKDYLKGFKDAFGDKASKLIVAEASYEVTDPTVDSQLVTLKSSGADVFFNAASPKFAARQSRRWANSAGSLSSFSTSTRRPWAQ
jgi:branched-chain amino acid transport system substrate-binding protein